jgi:signal transduction histidine kinase
VFPGRCRYTHASQDVTYDFELEPDVSEFVLSEQHWVWQMLMNLLSNARKFTTKGLISTKVSVVKNDGGPMLKFSVTAFPILAFTYTDVVNLISFKTEIDGSGVRR